LPSKAQVINRTITDLARLKTRKIVTRLVIRFYINGQIWPCAKNETTRTLKQV